MPLRGRNSKVIKAARLKEAGQVQLFEAEELCESRPEILVHQREGVVREIEFVCPCGCRATVLLETGEPEAQKETVREPASAGREAVAESPA